MLAAVTVIQPTLLFLTCSLHWQSVHSVSPKDPVFDDVQTTELPQGGVHRWRYARNLSTTSAYKASHSGSTVSPDFVRHIHNRIRNRELRIVRILLEVNDIMQHGRGNFSAAESPIGPRQLDSIKRRFDKGFEEDAKQQNGDSRISRIILLPACEMSVDRNRSLNGRTTKDFLLHFNIVPPRRILHPDTIQIKSAHLFLRLKSIDSVVLNANGVKKLMTKKSRLRADSTEIPNGFLKVQIHSFNASKPKEKPSLRGELRIEEGRKRRRGRGVASNKRPLKTISFNYRNSSDWLKIGLLKTAEKWYQTAVIQRGLRLTVVNSKNKPVDPFQLFHFDCDLQKSSEQHSQFRINAEKIGKSGKAEMRSGGDKVNDTRDNDGAFSFPYLEIVAKASPKKLVVRKQRHLTRQRRRSSCHMRPVHRSIGTEDKRFPNLTILAPAHFESAVCEGSCPRCRESSRPEANGDQTQLDRCRCRPVKETALSVLHVDKKGTVSKRNIPNMIVTKCGCRRL